MGTKSVLGLVVISFMLCLMVQETEAQWRGNTYRYWKIRYNWCWRCICRYWWGCSWWRQFRCREWYLDTRCLPGWTHNGNRDCSIPICRPRCANGGTCVRPNECDCPLGVTGAYCQTLLCAYERPCYPGNCYDNNKCNCTEGFDKDRGEYGCLTMEESEKPVIGRSTSIIEFVRATDQKQMYYFLLDGTDEAAGYPVWSNQNRFNLLTFEFEAKYEQPDEIPERPTYVHSMELGIVRGTVDVVARFFDGTKKQEYQETCTGASRDNPEEEIFNCTITDLRYITQTEHGESMTCTFTAYSGGYRRMLTGGSFGPFEYFTQVSETKSIEFKFDFIAPKHCSENDSFSTCTSESTPLTVQDEFTKGPINVRWHGWADESYGAGLWLYNFEVHKLINKNPATGLLTELNPILPNQTFNVSYGGDETQITVDEPGMYSILMETVDIANNSKWCRRFVLFDDTSDITIAEGEGLFFVSSANPGTNYTWQTATEGEATVFNVVWSGHFKNTFHEDNLLLNAVDKFPIQFADIEDDGVLSTSKFVYDALDDFEGERTRNSINNIHGIVKFEYQTITTLVEDVPTSGWLELSPLTDTVTFQELLENGDQVRVWVRAHDVMGNIKTDSTVVRIDSSPPKIQDKAATQFRLNVENGTHLHTSRITCDVVDEQSGVYVIDVNIVIDVPGESSERFYTSLPANMDNTKDPQVDTDCVSTNDPNICFIKEQTIDLDNCWFMIEDRLKLDRANATVTITAYNQALLSRSLSYEVNNLTALSGLAIYSGPTNFRIENVEDTSFRLAWDLPDKESCYGKANVVIVIFAVTGTGNVELNTRVVSSSSLYLDVAGLNPESRYSLSIGSEFKPGKTSPITSVSGETVAPSESSGVPIGAVVGAVVGVLVILVIVVVIMVFLVRRGVIHPVQRARSIKKRATTRIRKTIYGEEALRTRSHTNKSYQYDNRQSELYIYGGDDFDGPQAYHIDRDDITFETLIKSGHFANIYKASYKKTPKSVETVVAKTLKEHFSKEDETLMRAKINFTGSVVGEHPNVLKFIGAVVEDTARTSKPGIFGKGLKATTDEKMDVIEEMILGPFILYEYCEHGPLKDYLKTQKGNVTIEMQDNLFRFGLDIARGMEYLAAKHIVHRRLAARNILLTFLNEIKITGFGPQPLNEEDGDVEQGKKERIPIKWMAPECMKSTAQATEKSDVWSYAVVLWEIFSLGDDPYPNIRARDLPGKIKSGHRLAKPEQCDDVWYGVMTGCWQISQDKRPSFMQIRDELDSLFTQAAGDEDYYYYKR